MRISDDDMRDALIAALSSAAPEIDAPTVADRALAVLAEGRSGEATPALLTLNGRILLDLVVHPESSLQDCADRLGLTSPTVAHAMTRLVGEGWGVRTRSGGRNSYRFDVDRVLGHRDITAVLRAVAALAAPPAA